MSAFELRYERPAEGLPARSELAALVVELAWDGEAYVAPEGGEPVSFPLDAVPDERPPLFRASAMRSVNQQILAELRARGFGGLRVAHDPRDIEPRTGRDRRGDSSVLRVEVGVTEVASVGVRSDDGAGDLEGIRAQSPVKPGAALHRDAIAEYVSRLNRHGARRVRAHLRPTGERGRVDLEYRVTRTKPWLAYLRLSNTGTESTTRRREHLGFLHRELTGSDDALRLDYVTGDLDEVHAFVGSYERPVPGTEALRGGVDASWSRFDASQLGRDDAFSGRQWHLGGELAWNVLSSEGWLVDLTAGLRHQDVEIEDDVTGVEGSTHFLLPGVGVQAEREGQRMEARAALTFERNLASLGGTDSDELGRLGRSDVDRHFSILGAEASLDLFPLAWITGTRGDAWRLHETGVSLEGQYAFGDRLDPYHQRSVGGLYTVRGYPQSSVAGDDVLVGRAEYRFHLGRLLAAGGGGRSWDLSLRAFLDGGRTEENDPQPLERDETLWAAGLGFDLRVSHVSFGFDWGRALSAVQGVSAGSNEYHLVGTVHF